MMDVRDAFRRTDESPDARFYQQARLVEHIDRHAIGAVEELYRENLPAGGAILDLMSSWVSHLPPEISYGRVVALGMNRAELAANPRLDAYDVHDLNVEPTLPFAEASFDAVTICVSVQYLTRPIEVMREIARVLRPNGVLVISFSNRCFPTKAVAVWRMLDDCGHRELVASYLAAAGGFAAIAGLDRSPRYGDPLHAVVARRAAIVDRATDLPS